MTPDISSNQKRVPTALEFQKEVNRNVISSITNAKSRVSERMGGMNTTDKGYAELEKAYESLLTALRILESFEVTS